MPNFYRVHPSTLWNPLQNSPLRGSPPLRTLLRSWEANSSRLLTLVGWAEGWSRSLTPVFPSFRSTISPPRRHSQSGRLPAAPAPSPSRTQVCNDKEIEIQQISHIRLLSSHPRHLSSLSGVGKHQKGFLSLHAAAAAAARWK